MLLATYWLGSTLAKNPQAREAKMTAEEHGLPGSNGSRTVLLVK